MTRMQWWWVIRMAAMGLALALVVAASAEGCEEGGGGSSEVNCPGIGEMLSVASVANRLPRSELADDLEYAKYVAERVAMAEDGTCERAAKGWGYKITVTYTKARPHPCARDGERRRPAKLLSCECRREGRGRA